MYLSQGVRLYFLKEDEQTLANLVKNLSQVNRSSGCIRYDEACSSKKKKSLLHTEIFDRSLK